MQDGARPHRTTDIFELLFEHFDERIIALDSSSKIGVGIDWPAYSPDMNACDYFLWGYLKDRIYAKSPKTIDQLKKAIEKEINLIEIELLQRVIANFEERLREVHDQNGWHVEPYLI